MSVTRYPEDGESVAQWWSRLAERLAMLPDVEDLLRAADEALAKPLPKSAPKKRFKHSVAKKRGMLAPTDVRLQVLKEMPPRNQWRSGIRQIYALSLGCVEYKTEQLLALCHQAQSVSDARRMLQVAEVMLYPNRLPWVDMRVMECLAYLFDVKNTTYLLGLRSLASAAGLYVLLGTYELSGNYTVRTGATVDIDALLHRGSAKFVAVSDADLRQLLQHWAQRAQPSIVGSLPTGHLTAASVAAWAEQRKPAARWGSFSLIWKNPNNKQRSTLLTVEYDGDGVFRDAWLTWASGTDNPSRCLAVENLLVLPGCSDLVAR